MWLYDVVGMSSHLDKQVKKWIEKVRQATTPMGHKKVLRKGAKVIQNEMKRIIKSEANNSFYTSVRGTRTRPKFVNRYKKGGAGGIQATYHKGNLSRSIRIMTFKRSKAVFIGTKLTSGGGLFKGRRVDGYYAHMVNNGTSTMRGVFFKERAADNKRKEAKKVVVAEARRVLGRQTKKLGLR